MCETECVRRGGGVQTALVRICRVGKLGTLKFTSPIPPQPPKNGVGSRWSLGVSFLTTQDIVLCKRVTEIWSQTAEPEGAQRLESYSEGQRQEAMKCLPWSWIETRKMQGLLT